MNNERENHVVPALVAVVGVVALAALIYLLFVGVGWLLDRGLGGVGTPL